MRLHTLFRYIKKMAADERNFRSAYYEKVGFKSVEEKRSLEILLKDKHLDLTKLKQFCLRFGVPTDYKNLVWKVLLGVIPVHVNCHAFVMEQRKTEYSDILHALKVMRIINETPKPQVFVAVWLLQTGNLRYDVNLNGEKSFLAIVQTLMFFIDNDVDIYWLAKQFYDSTSKFQNEIPKLIETTHSLLEKEDQQLHKHLIRIDVLNNLPFEQWFSRCFAGIISDIALGKIWDKICGGSYKILVYVAIVMLISLKARILKCISCASILKYINNISEDMADMIANKSIELWQQHGSPLTIHDKPKP